MRKSKTCKGCMWNWEEVHGGKGRVCYRQESQKYHKAANGGCDCYEEKPRIGRRDIWRAADVKGARA